MAQYTRWSSMRSVLRQHGFTFTDPDYGRVQDIFNHLSNVFDHLEPRPRKNFINFNFVAQQILNSINRTDINITQTNSSTLQNDLTIWRQMISRARPELGISIGQETNG